jgi:hypothetical protein
VRKVDFGKNVEESLNFITKVRSHMSNRFKSLNETLVTYLPLFFKKLVQLTLKHNLDLQSLKFDPKILAMVQRKI